MGQLVLTLLLGQRLASSMIFRMARITTNIAQLEARGVAVLGQSALVNHDPYLAHAVLAGRSQLRGLPPPSTGSRFALPG